MILRFTRTIWISYAIVHIGIGSNLGDRKNISEGAPAFSRKGDSYQEALVNVMRQSRGGKDQPRFINMAIEGADRIRARGLLKF